MSVKWECIDFRFFGPPFKSSFNDFIDIQNNGFKIVYFVWNMRSIVCRLISFRPKVLNLKEVIKQFFDYKSQTSIKLLNQILFVRSLAKDYILRPLSQLWMCLRTTMVYNTTIISSKLTVPETCQLKMPEQFASYPSCFEFALLNLCWTSAKPMLQILAKFCDNKKFEFWYPFTQNSWKFDPFLQNCNHWANNRTILAEEQTKCARKIDLIKHLY